MSYRNWILLFFVFITASLGAQQPCSSHEMTQKLIETFPEYATELADLNLETARLSQSASNRSSVIIPVVVHVIHGGESVGSGSNVSFSRIQSQIDILNDDFQRMNADASQTPSAFQPVAGNANIRFGLAIIDPNGNSTSGVTRHQYNNVNSTDFIENTIKPQTTWDSNRYLNIWSVNIPSSTVIGYSYLPTQTMVGSTRDGLVVTHEKFGYINSSNRGRTATHEIGHYLGLQHIWGQNNSNGNPIGCGSDDNIADTPNQDGPYYGCPSSGSSCSSNDMFMNFMDYTDDYCMNLFTQGQTNVMNGILQGIRKELISGNLTGNTDECFPLSSNDFNHGFEPSQPNNEWSVVNNNGDDRTWIITDQSGDDWGPNNGVGSAIYFWNPDLVTPGDDYLFSPCMDLKADHQYRLSFSMAAAEDINAFYPERLEVGFSTNQTVAEFFTISNDWIFDPVTNIYPDYRDENLFFTTDNDLDISIGFHVFSEADKYALMLDNVEITDMGSVNTNDIPRITTGFSLFPNPTDGYTRLTLDQNTWLGPTTMKLYNSIGMLITSKDFDASQHQIELNLSDLTAGVYFCEVTNGEKRIVERILKQ